MNQLVLKKKNELTKKKKGFTLVELIIVIAVIAVLAAVAIPKFGKVKEDANLRADQANAKIIATAVSSAVADGLDPTTGVVNSSSNFITYIDGQSAPKSKTKDSTGFSVAYTSTGGTIVTVIGGTGFTAKQVYPATE